MESVLWQREGERKGGDRRPGAIGAGQPEGMPLGAALSDNKAVLRLVCPQGLVPFLKCPPGLSGARLPPTRTVLWRLCPTATQTDS